MVHFWQNPRSGPCLSVGVRLERLLSQDPGFQYTGGEPLSVRVTGHLGRDSPGAQAARRESAAPFHTCLPWDDQHVDLPTQTHSSGEKTPLWGVLTYQPLRWRHTPQIS